MAAHTPQTAQRPHSSCILAKLRMNRLFDISNRIKTALSAHALPSRVLLLPLAVMLGYVFVEFTWNANAFTMNAALIGANLLMLAFVFAAFYFIGQQSRTSIVAFWLLCLVLGIAEYYVISFRGQPVVPADLFALDTAGEVASGYSYAPSTRMVISIITFIIACVALLHFPKVKLTAKAVVANALAGILFLGGFCWYMKDGDITENFGIIVGEWNTLWYYENQGTALCFLDRVQDLFPDAPQGYSPSKLDENLAGHGGATANDLAEYQLAIANGEQAPNVLIIMNESFSDLSTFESLAGSAAYPAAFYEIAADSLVSGTAYAACFGAGTCNSEFEVLTGASMANMGEDVYPYVLYDLADNENLASYFNALGYETTAMHPAESKNWRRDRVYPQLGFNTFLSTEDFTEAETLRWYVDDKSTYDKALGLISESDEPQFILNVTMQNHGGYTSGLIPEEDSYHAPINGVEYDDLNEYVSLMQRSDESLAYLIEQLEQLDEPVIVLFFGDHQPSLSGTPEEELYGKTLENSSLTEIQKRYEVPYFIWANYEPATQGDEQANATANTQPVALDTSLNYLGAMLVNESGLPLTSYQQLILSTQESIPAINLNGVMDASGTWYSLEGLENGALPSAMVEALNAYAIAQYGNLFDRSAGEELLIR